MKTQPPSPKVGLLVPALLAAATTVPVAASDNWPSFRGNAADGNGTGAPPATWNVETGENVLFRVAVPGLGHSSPRDLGRSSVPDLVRPRG